MLVIITKRYDSSVLKQKVHPTLIDNDGKPINPLTVSDERGHVLIAAGVAKEYIPTTDEDMDNSAVQTVSESNDNSDAKEEGDVVTDDSSAAAEDDAENVEDKSAETESTEETDAKEESKDADDETKSKKETKKNKESK